MSQSHYNNLAAMYYAAPCNQGYQDLEMTISQGLCEVSFTAVASQQHAAGGIHGSYYFKLMDDAAFFAANSLVEDVFVLTASFNVNLFRPVREGKLTCYGKVTKPGRQLIFAESRLVGPDGKELGRGNGTFARSAHRLADVAAYPGS